MDDTAMQAAKALIRGGSSQMEAGAELRRKRYAKNLGTTQADFDELSRYVFAVNRRYDDLRLGRE